MGSNGQQADYHAPTLVGGGTKGREYLQEEGKTYLGEPFEKMKPLMKLAGVNNPQFTAADDGPWAPPVCVRQLNHVAIEAVDVDAICRFYTKVLGFQQVPRPDLGFPGHWLKGSGLMIHIIQRDPSVPHRLGPNWKDAYSQEPEAWFIRRSNHLAFEVEDFEGAEARLRQHGVEFSRHVLPEANVRQLFFYDPEGFGIELGCYGNTRQFFEEHGEPPTP